MATRLLFVHAMTPLHAGTGQAIGAIDLPIARERPTGIPLVPGSSIKGALRDRENDEPLRDAIFGKGDAEYSGAVQIADVHLVLLPVRSLRGTFAWVTSPYLLSRYARNAKEAGFTQLPPFELNDSENCCVLAENLVAKIHDDQGAETKKVVLEDLDFRPAPELSKSAEPYAELLAQSLFPESDETGVVNRRLLRERLCIIHDDPMAYLLESATEVTARIRLDENKKTVAEGALWYEEALPAESVLCGLTLARGVRRGDRGYEAEELLDRIAEKSRGMVQLGGKATVGRGLCRIFLPRS